MPKLATPRRIRASRIRETVAAGEGRCLVCVGAGEGEAIEAARVGTSAMPRGWDGSVGGYDRVSGRGGEGVADEVSLADGAGKEPGGFSETTFAVEGAGTA